jgi:hypothetical protein
MTDQELLAKAVGRIREGTEVKVFALYYGQLDATVQQLIYERSGKLEDDFREWLMVQVDDRQLVLEGV